MTEPTLPSLLQGFFTERLARQLQASPQTVSAYRDTIKLLLVFAARKSRKPPSRLTIDDLDAVTVGAKVGARTPPRGRRGGSAWEEGAGGPPPTPAVLRWGRPLLAPATVPNITDVAPVKPVPVNVTLVPPAMGPVGGATAVTRRSSKYR